MNEDKIVECVYLGKACECVGASGWSLLRERGAGYTLRAWNSADQMRNVTHCPWCGSKFSPEVAKQ